MSAIDGGAEISAAARLIDAGSLAAAERLLKAALAKDPEHPRAHALMALVLYRSDRALAAVTEADRAIGLEPTEEALRFKALALTRLGRHGAAIEAAEAAVRAAPQNGWTQFTKAIALENAKRPVLAEAAYRAAVALDPGAEIFRANLGRFLLRRGDRAGAERIGTELNANSDVEAVLLLRGELALARGRAPEAREFALWVLRQDATNVSALRLLAQAKASQSLVLGLWWRWSMFVMAMKPFVRLLVVPPLIFTLLVFTPFGLGLLFGLYLFVCRQMFHHMIIRELKTVTLRAGY